MKLRWVLPLLLLLNACRPGVKTVRLEAGRGASSVITPPSHPASVRLSAEAFTRAMARLTLDVPLTVHPGQEGTGLMLASSWGPEDGALHQTWKKGYGHWCARYQASGDCLSLLEDGFHLDKDARLRLALALALDPVWDGVADAVKETRDPSVLKGMVASALAGYVLMLAAPDPVVTQDEALVLTAWLVAYLGPEPFWALVQECIRLKEATEEATTVEALEAASNRFGQSVGANNTRILVLFTTATFSGRAGMLSQGPMLPAYAQAATLARAQAGFQLAAVAEIQSIAVTGSGFVVRLAPTAVARSARSSK